MQDYVYPKFVAACETVGKLQDLSPDVVGGLVQISNSNKGTEFNYQPESTVREKSLFVPAFNYEASEDGANLGVPVVDGSESDLKLSSIESQSNEPVEESLSVALLPTPL